MEAIAAGKGRRPKPFMLQGGKVAGRCGLGQPHGPREPKSARRRARQEESRKGGSYSQSSRLHCPAALRDPEPAAVRTGWIHEIKFDGYRIQMRVLDGEVTLKTRKGLDWTAKYPAIARAAGKLPDAIIDGEIVALDENGAPDFAALQAALSQGKTDGLVYFAFDLLFEGGEDLRALPLIERKARLEAISLGSRRRRPPSLCRAFRDRRRGSPPLGLPAVARRDRVEARPTHPTSPAARRPGRSPSAVQGTRW